MTIETREGKALTSAIHVLRQAHGALADLAEHEAFKGDAPEFNRGGIGYEAICAIERVIYGSA